MSLDELPPFLTHKNPEVRSQALGIVQGYSTNPPLFQGQPAILKNLCKLVVDKELSEKALITLVNLSDDFSLAVQLVKFGIFQLTMRNLKVQFTQGGGLLQHPYHLMLLTNLTRNDKDDTASKVLCQWDSPKRGQWLTSLVQWFSEVPKDQTEEKDHLAYIGHILTNVTQHECGRVYFYKAEKNFFPKLIPQLLYGSSTRRLGVLRPLRNCLIDANTVGEYRFTYLIEECGIYPAFMIPIVGPGTIDEEDKSGMPDLIQEFFAKVPPVKRDEDTEVRAAILDIILCCARHKKTRIYLRERNTYMLIRDLHNEEKELERTQFDQFIEDLVGFFILDEDDAAPKALNARAAARAAAAEEMGGGFVINEAIEMKKDPEEEDEEEADEEEAENAPEDAGDLDDIS